MNKLLMLANRAKDLGWEWNLYSKPISQERITDNIGLSKLNKESLPDLSDRRTLLSLMVQAKKHINMELVEQCSGTECYIFYYNSDGLQKIYSHGSCRAEAWINAWEKCRVLNEDY